MLADAKKLEEAAALLARRSPTAERSPRRLLPDARGRREPDAAGRHRRRPALAVIDQGLAVQPDALELVQAKYQLLRQTGDDKAAAAFVESKAKDAGNDDFRRLLVEVYRDRRTTPAPSGSSASCSRRTPRIRRWRRTWSGWPAPGDRGGRAQR